MNNNINADKNKKSNDIKFYFIEIIEMIFFVIFLYIMLENIKYNNLSYYFKVYAYLIITRPQYIFISHIILVSFILLFRGIIKNKFIADLTVTFLFIIITTISFYKFNAIEQPFVPYDISMIKNIGQVAKFGITKLPYMFYISILNIILLLTFHYVICEIIKGNLKDKKRLIIQRIASFLFAIVLIYTTCISPARYANNKIKNDNGDNYHFLGANGVFFTHLGDFYTKAPKNYNLSKIEQIKNEYNNEIKENTKKHVNIILIMNESFADLSNFKNTTYSKNPMESINALYLDKNFKRGEILSPVFGGGTSMPEFEALTGLTSFYLEQQIYPYTSYIHNNMNSLVREYNRANYTTIGIHTNTKTFYNRENIYKYLGFQKTIFEEDISNPEYKGGYISDDEAADQIIEQFNKNKGNKFIFTVTMQNHMKYLEKQYDNYDIEIESSVLSDSEKLELKNYTQGVVDGCKMYIKLVEYLKQINEPTILIMFGDHLPLLGDAYSSTYKKNNIENEIDYYITPYFIWANYDIEELDNMPDLLSPSNLGFITLDFAGINNISWYLKPFEELYKKYPAINNKFIVDLAGNLVNDEEIKEQELVKNCEIIQYDLLIKKKYLPINN